MNWLTPTQIGDLLARAGPGASCYLVGAGGCGMSALGHLLLDLGFLVGGSDLQTNDEIAGLQKRGALIGQGHSAQRLESMRPALVIASSAILRENPELERARERQMPAAKRAHALAALMRRQRGVCVAGMHGKTTVTAMLACALERLGADASYAVGWRVPQLERHGRFRNPARGAEPPWFVAEIDESDGTLNAFSPEYAVVLNVDDEHQSYFASFEAACREFGDFGRAAERGLIFCRDDARLTALFERHPRAISYGFHPQADYRLEEPSPAAAASGKGNRAPGSVPLTRFEIRHQDRRLGEFTTRLLGRHNISNAAAAVALLHQMGFAADRIGAALAEFRGAFRRQEELFRDSDFAIYDDYGHHPNEIRVTLQSIAELGAKRVLVAFQPHRFSRTQHLLKEFATCFAGADRLWLMEIYPAGEPAIAGVDARLLAAEIERHGQKAEVVKDAKDLVDRVRAGLAPGDLAVFLGAGADITTAAHALAAELKSARRAPSGPDVAVLGGNGLPKGLVPGSSQCCRNFAIGAAIQ